MHLEWLNEASNASADDFSEILSRASEILTEEKKRRNESGLVLISAGQSLQKKCKIMVVGDIHGDFESLSRIIKDFFAYNADKIVFLGDYGDRGNESVEVYYALLKFKTIVDGGADGGAEQTEKSGAAGVSENVSGNNSERCEGRGGEERVIFLRGNHEGPPDLPVLPHELPFLFRKKYGADGKQLYERVEALWEILPHSAFIKCARGGGYLLMHGGVPENTESIEDIAYAHLRHPHTSHLEEILWNDPMEGEGCVFSMRGAGKNFGADVTERVLRILNAETLIRSHEPCDEGFSVAHNGRILTIFSRKGAPYFNNYAAYLILDENALINAKNAYKLASENIVRW